MNKEFRNEAGCQGLVTVIVATQGGSDQEDIGLKPALGK
jgi:hypothetical protein